MNVRVRNEQCTGKEKWLQTKKRVKISGKIHDDVNNKNNNNNKTEENAGVICHIKTVIEEK